MIPKKREDRSFHCRTTRWQVPVEIDGILREHNPDCRALTVLSRTRSPLRKWSELSPRDRKDLTCLRMGSHELAFFPLYQPAWAHALKYEIDYGPLRGSCCFQGRGSALPQVRKRDGASEG